MAVVLVLFVLWAGVTTAEPPGPRPAAGPSTRDDGGGDESDGTGLPLEVDRLVPLDMTEGSWISLEVSPDGEPIVFDFLGDLFTVPIAGGDATQFTSGVAFDAQPRFSPDGSRIVYTSDADGGQNVWVMDSDGSDPVQISKGASNRAESPEWMPDGTTWWRRWARSASPGFGSWSCSTWTGAAASSSSRSPTMDSDSSDPVQISKARTARPATRRGRGSSG